MSEIDLGSIKNATKRNAIPFEYQHVDMKYVIQNPEEYIIPECLPACKALWEKNIPTFMVSNHEDTGVIYVLIDYLSEENMRIFSSHTTGPKVIEGAKEDPNFFYSFYRRKYGIRVLNPSENPNAVQELTSLVDELEMQDVSPSMYMTEEQLLDSYKREGGDYELHDDGTLERKINPERANATLEEAIEALKKGEILDEDYFHDKAEKRIYLSRTYYEWHKRYLEMRKKRPSGKEEI